MSYQKQIKRVLSRLEDVEEIKLEDCKVYNEFSVVVLYPNDSDIIICDNSKDANRIYSLLTEEHNRYKSSRQLSDDTTPEK